MSDLLEKMGPDTAFIRITIFDLTLQYPNEESVWRKFKENTDPRARNLSRKDFHSHYSWCVNKRVRAKLLKNRVTFLQSTDQSTEHAISISQAVMAKAWDWLDHLRNNAKRDFCTVCKGTGEILDSEGEKTGLICNICEGKGYQLNWGTAAYSAAQHLRVISEENLHVQELAGLRSAKGVVHAVVNVQDNSITTVNLNSAVDKAEQIIAEMMQPKQLTGEVVDVKPDTEPEEPEF